MARKKTTRALTTVDVGRSVRRWWQHQQLEECTDATTLAKALADVGVLSLAHLAKRLSSDDTPMRVRDQIALAMGPKLAVEVRGRMSKSDHQDDETSGIMENYRIRN